MKRIRLPMPWSLLAGLILLSAASDALKGNVLVLNKLRSKPDDTPAPSPENKTATEEAAGNGTLAEAAANSTKSPLTGIPQIDYVLDPNLPRELNGYNLKDYPFYDRVPDDMDFKCDGLHDGFYASVPHKCQVYHHCLFGTRYDFLCANYTAFDQKTFICHFVSEVDCVNSPKYFNRNEALYKSASSTTTTTVAPPRTTPPPPPRRQDEPEAPPPGRRRRPYRRRRPVYEYVYDDEYEDVADDYEDDAAVTQGRGSSVRASRPADDELPRRNRPRPQQRPVAVQDDLQDPPHRAELAADLKPKPSSSVYDRPRMAPRIRRPVPLNEREKYDYSKHPSIVTTPANVEEPRVESNPRPKSQQSPSTRTREDDYYYDEEEYVPPSRSTHGQVASRTKPVQDYYPEEDDVERRPPKAGGGVSPRRNIGHAGSRKRINSASVDIATSYPAHHESDEYDDVYDELPRRVVRPSNARRRVKDHLREDDVYVRRPVQSSGYNTRPRSKPQRYEPDDYLLDEDPVPATRPAYISRPQSSRDGYSSRRRPQQQADTTATDYEPSRSQSATDYKRPAGRKPLSGRYSTGYASDADYYDETEELLDEPENYRSRPKQTTLPTRGTSGNQYEASAREDDGLLPASKTRPYTNSRLGSSNSPSYQQQPPQYSSGKSQPPRNYPLASQSEVEDRPRILQQPVVYREKTTEDDRGRPPTTQRYNKAQVRDPEPTTPRVQLVPKGFTAQSSAKSEDTYINANPSRTITASGNEEYRRRLNSDDSLPPRLPPITASVNSYQPKAVPSGDQLSRTSFGKYRSASEDTESISVTSATPERTTEASASSRPTTPKDNSGNKTSADYQTSSSRGGSNYARPLGKLSLKPAVRERENVHIIPEDEPLRHNLADVSENDDDVTRNDVLSPSIPATRSVPSGPAYLKSGDGQPRFRVKLFKSKLTPQFTSQDNPSQSSPKNASKDIGSTDVELSSSLAGGGGSGGGDSRGYLVTSASQTQYTRAPFPTHSKDIVLEGSASDLDDRSGSNSPVPSVGGSFNQRHLDQYSSSPKRESYPELPTGENVYVPQSRQAWSQQRKRSSSQYLSSPN